jgi:hypothetical protein
VGKYLDGRTPRDDNPARADAARLLGEVVPLVNQAQGATWYSHYRNDADIAVVELCRLRRAGAGSDMSGEAGDEAVRSALQEAEPEAVVWLASRLISYMDEQGYPETLAPWLES